MSSNFTRGCRGFEAEAGAGAGGWAETGEEVMEVSPIWILERKNEGQKYKTKKFGNLVNYLLLMVLMQPG